MAKRVFVVAGLLAIAPLVYGGGELGSRTLTLGAGLPPTTVDVDLKFMFSSVIPTSNVHRHRPNDFCLGKRFCCCSAMLTMLVSMEWWSFVEAGTSAQSAVGHVELSTSWASAAVDRRISHLKA